MQIDNCYELVGFSGEIYKFLLHPRIETLSRVPGVYLLTRWDGERHQPAQCGATADLARTIAALPPGADWTHLGLLYATGPIRRASIVDDLYANADHHWAATTREPLHAGRKNSTRAHADR